MQTTKREFASTIVGSGIAKVEAGTHPVEIGIKVFRVFFVHCFLERMGLDSAYRSKNGRWKLLGVDKDTNVYDDQRHKADVGLIWESTS